MPERITTLVNRLGRTIHCLQFADGLNPAQWEALRYLGRANKYSRTPSALAEYLRTTKGTASQTLKSLEAKGLVARVPHPRDRRGVILAVTETGRAALSRDPLNELERMAEGLGADLEEANRLLSRLVGGLEEANGMKAFGRCDECTHFCRNVVEAATDPHQCGLTGEPLSVEESRKICINHSLI